MHAWILVALEKYMWGRTVAQLPKVATVSLERHILATIHVGERMLARIHQGL
jgi:hypothetical protein